MGKDIRHPNRTLLLMAWLCLAAVVAPQRAAAQFYNGSQLSFGKSRVQHQNYNWQLLRADRYDVYYYPTGRSLAQYVYFKAPQVMAEIEAKLQYASKKKLQLIVYNTQEDFRESNFAYDDDDFYNQGGVTNVYGTKIYIYFDGNRAHLDRMIRSGVMNVYAHWLVQGATVGSNMTYDYLMDVSNWYFSGLASYFGESWNSDIDAHVKDGILTQRYADFDDLSPREATYAGHSLWRYVADTYGEEAVYRILYATRAFKSVSRAFSHVTQVPYQTLLYNWYKYYCVMYYPDLERQIPQGNGIVRHPRPGREYTRFRFAPDGNGYAFVTNESGQVRVWLKTAGDKKPRCIRKRFPKIEDNPDLSYPLLAWHPKDSILGMTFESKGHCYYYPYDVARRKWRKRFLVDVEKITSWCYSDDGRMMLFSGFKNGQSDIFLYSFLSRSFQNLTDDFYDDYAPVFVRDQRQIVFSSNRPRDSIRLKDSFTEAAPQGHYDLFLYSYAQDDPALLRVPGTETGNAYDARRVDQDNIIYLDDGSVYANQYIANFDSSVCRIDTAVHYLSFATSRPLTDMGVSVLEHDYNAARRQTAKISLKNGVMGIFTGDMDLNGTPEVTPSFFHQKVLLDKRRDERRQRADTVVSDSLSADSIAPKEEFHIPVGSGYKVQYSINKVITQADFSFLNTTYQQFEGGTSPIYLNTGFNALFMLGINDLFEDYRVSGGFRVGVDLNSYEFMMSYENLSRRLDRQVVIYRQSITSDIRDYVYKQRSNSLFYILKYPFNKIHSVRLTLSGRYESNVTGALSDNSLRMPDERHVWAGVKLEYVFDSSKELYTNLWRGTKMKIFAEYNQRVEKETRNLLVVGLDARQSFKLYKNMTFALRLAASANTGSARLVYYMGGVDNWINAKFNSDIWVDQSKNYAYQTLATNMRGFTQNIRNGTSFVLLSGELRVPFVQLIMGHKVSLNFLNSLQLNLFGDFGTAWTGTTPYSEENCLYTRYVTSGPVSVMVKRQVDPFVGGFGAGLRCSLLSYFLRFNYAWGVEDFKISDKKGMFLFSIGTDF